MYRPQKSNIVLTTMLFFLSIVITFALAQGMRGCAVGRKIEIL